MTRKMLVYVKVQIFQIFLIYGWLNTWIWKVAHIPLSVYPICKSIKSLYTCIIHVFISCIKMHMYIIKCTYNTLNVQYVYICYKLV